MTELQSPVTALKGVGPKLAEKLERIAVFKIQDLLFHLPLRYQDRTQVSAIKSLRHATYAVVEGVIESTEIKYGNKRSLICAVRDSTGVIHIRFFHFTKPQQSRLIEGARLRLFGEAKRLGKRLEIVHPEYQFIDENNPPELAQTLTPIYPTTEGLHQKTLQGLVAQALEVMMAANDFTDLLPGEICQALHYPELKVALQTLHNPPPETNLYQLLNGKHPAQKRLAFEELLAHNLSLRKLKALLQADNAPPLPRSKTLVHQFLDLLPFALTGAQQRVSEEIAHDLTQQIAMLRLVQGDVGSGKTVIAAIAALQAIEQGYQVAFMSPTEILAEQHIQNFAKWFCALDLPMVTLTGKMKAKEKRDACERLAMNMAPMAIGTHALFQDSVSFAKLGLVIIDEQHRFGVHQRLSLREKGNPKYGTPHQLVMTATPIPRTLSMSFYADLDHSVIDELPPGRTPVQTAVLSNDKRAEVVTRIEHACQEKRQVYWVCTLIEESEVLQCQAAGDTAIELQKVLPNVRVGLVHGRLAANEKEAIMHAFKEGEIDLLVATTVIEVGVDVPNASLMIIENAERLGLSQLHQLRGRVGRGEAVSHCVLLYQPPLSGLAKQRLSVMREYTDGFTIAEKDLEIRGPGEVLGTKQAGLIQFRVACLERDAPLLPKVQEVALSMRRHFPEQAEALIDRWLATQTHLGKV